MAFTLDAKSVSMLSGVHPDLVRVVKRAAALSPKKFRVIEGTRTIERQRQLVARGASQTMNSRHIPGANGYGHAVDIVPLEADGDVSWAWPDYYPLAKIVKEAARVEKVPIEWGGDWSKFKDGPHWQLPWKQYPGAAEPVKAAKPITNKTEKQAATQEAAAAASGGVLSGGTIAAGPIVDAISGQQDALSSGDYVKIGLAIFIILLTAYFVWQRMKSSE